MIEEKLIYTKRTEIKNSKLSNQVLMNEVIHTVKNESACLNKKSFDQSTFMSESNHNKGSCNDIPFTEIVKNILIRPSATVQRFTSNVEQSIFPSSISSCELNQFNKNSHDKKYSNEPTVKNVSHNKNTELKATSLIINTHYNSDRNIKDENKYRKTDKSNSTSMRSRSSGPINKILATTSNNSRIILEKKSIDKFLKLASNSASELDLNKQGQLSFNGNSSMKQKTNNNNLAMLCGIDPNLNPSYISLKKHIPINKENELSNSTNNSKEKHINISSQKLEPNLDKPSNTISYNSINDINKPNEFSNFYNDIHYSNLNNDNNLLLNKKNIIRKINDEKDNISIKNIHINHDNIQSMLVQSNKNSTNEFRIPSSRHFCGRLLSSNLSSTSTDTSRSSTASSDSSTSETINKITKDTSDEEFEELTIQSNKIDKSQSKKGALESPLEAESTSSPSTTTSTSNSPSPIIELKSYNIKNDFETGKKSINDNRKDENKNKENECKKIFGSNDFNQNNQDFINELSRSNNILLKKTNNENDCHFSNKQLKKSSTLNFPENNFQHQNYDNIDFNNQQNKYQSNRELNKSEKCTISNKNQSLAKSVEHLLAGSVLVGDSDNRKKQLLVKQIDIDSQKEINTILAANSRQMGLSKSIKDLRLFVSNSYSPSQIVKPPQPNLSSFNINTSNVDISNENYTKKVQHHGQNQSATLLNYENAVTMNKNFNIGKEKLLPQTKLNLYTKTMLKPLKDERSDQIRMEYLKQQALISKLQKHQLKEHLNKETTNIKGKLRYKETYPNNDSYEDPINKNHEQLNRDKRDDELINCILGMKPMSTSNLDRDSQNKSNSQYFELSNSVINPNKISLNSKLPMNSNLNLNQHHVSNIILKS